MPAELGGFYLNIRANLGKPGSVLPEGFGRRQRI